MASNGSPTPTIVFIPGAWHGPWCFDEVRSQLSSRGFDTATVELATVGATNPNVGLFDDTAAIKPHLEKLAEAGKEIVLVGHSYGGIVASNCVEGLGIHQRAVTGKQGGIIMVVYMAAFALASGTSLLDKMGNIPPPWWNAAEDGFITVKDPGSVFYTDFEASLASQAIERLRQMPSQWVKDKSAYAPWNEGFQVGYIFAEKDQTIPIEVQKAMFSQFPTGLFQASVAAGHFPFVSMPKEVAGAIERAALPSYAVAKGGV